MQEKKPRYNSRQRAKARESITARCSPLRKQERPSDEKELEIQFLKEQLRSEKEKANNERLLFESKLAAKELKYREKLEAELIEQKIYLRSNYLNKIEKLKGKLEKLGDIENRRFRDQGKKNDNFDPESEAKYKQILQSVHSKYKKKIKKLKSQAKKGDVLCDRCKAYVHLQEALDSRITRINQQFM